tara:strand:- start:878 stop:1834 length:957 start_codon:yes stop_codon:yes gene_type:complete
MGSIRKLKENWRAEVCLEGRRKSKVCKTKREAARWINEAESAGLSSSMTVGSILARYKETVSVHKRGVKWESDRIKCMLKLDLAQVRLDKLSEKHIAEWRDYRLLTVSGSTVSREWTLIDHALSLAVREWKLLAINPMRNVRRPKENAPRDRVMTDDEVTQLLRALGHPGDTKTAQVGDALLLALETAMRTSEITTMLVDQVRGDHVHLPKTKNGVKRNVPLSRKAREIIAHYTLGKKSKDNVFDVSAASLDVLFRKARDRTFIEDLHFHDSRRTALTRMAKIFGVLELAEISGHLDLRILKKVYYAPDVSELASKLD